MVDDHEGVTVGTQNTSHQFRGADEFCRHDADRGLADFFANHCVMQTARRATASVADAGDHRVPILRFFNEMGIGGGAVVGLDGPDDFGDAEFGPQLVFERVKERGIVFFFPFEMMPTVAPSSAERRDASAKLPLSPSWVGSKISRLIRFPLCRLKRI